MSAGRLSLNAINCFTNSFLASSLSLIFFLLIIPQGKHPITECYRITLRLLEERVNLSNSSDLNEKYLF